MEKQTVRDIGVGAAGSVVATILLLLTANTVGLFKKSLDSTQVSEAANEIVNKHSDILAGKLKNDPKFIQLVKGEKGLPGPQGVAGPQGAAGPPGSSSIFLKAGNNGSAICNDFCGRFGAACIGGLPASGEKTIKNTDMFGCGTKRHLHNNMICVCAKNI
ncbi:MAG: collagen-like protein [Gammaproteobacteria bacterium]|nr:collagen-like protein [Gammaproteobacteria bacterium]MDH5799636.1 collagen-like protein [Gammaproteobacteria bacterium]